MDRAIWVLRVRVLLGVLVLLAFGATACGSWSGFRSGAARPGSTPFERVIGVGNVATLSLAWTGTTGGEISSPAVVGGRAYVLATDGRVQAFDAAGQQGCSGTPTTCAPLWTGMTGNTFTTPPAVANGKVYVASGANVFVFDAAGQTGCTGTPTTCTPLWIAVGPCAAGTVCFANAPVVANGIVYVGFTVASDTCPPTCEGKLLAFDAAGATGCAGAPKSCEPIWTATVNCGPNATACGVTPVAIAGGVAYVGSDANQGEFGSSGQLLAFDAAGVSGCSVVTKICSPLWVANTLGVLATPAVADGRVYVGQHSFPTEGSPQGALSAFDAGGVTGCTGTPKTCTPLWSVDVDGEVFSSPAVGSGIVVVGSRWDNRLEAFDASTGTPRWTAPTALGVIASPSIANGVVYAIDGGTLIALDAAGTLGCSAPPTTCNPLATVAIGPLVGFYVEPTIVNGSIYLGASDALRVLRLP